MSLTSKDNGSEFESAPSGTHLAICYQIVDLGFQDGTYGPKLKVYLGFELCNEKMADGRPFMIGQMYTNSLNEKANLRIALESWRAAKFSDDDLNGFDLRNVLGVPCILTIVHNENGGKTYANIADFGKGITAKMKGMEVPDQVNPSVVYDMDQHDQAVFDALPEWMQTKIKEAGQRVETVSGPVSEQPAPEFDDLEEVPF